MARISDATLLEIARREAKKLFETAPCLKKPEHKTLLNEMSRVWAKDIGEQS
jgi:hypothetical protein